MTLGLVLAIVLANGPISKSTLMVLTGIVLSMVSADVDTGEGRMTFGRFELSDGFGFIVVAMGVFGFAEVIKNLLKPSARELIAERITNLMPTRRDFSDAAPAIARGTILGSLLGILPGGGAILSSFASYTLEKKLSKTPERFGKGAIEGVAGPESANNAASQTSFIPLLTLGIPANAVMALMVGAMTLHGITPGPQVATKQPDLFWGLIASMWVGNLMLLVINLPLIGVWVRLLRVPYRLLYPMILVFCCIGVYSLNTSTFEIMLALAFGLFGYWLYKHDFEAAPLLLGFILGPMMEENLRKAMKLARGDILEILMKPLTGILLASALVLLIVAILPAVRRKRETVFVE